MIFGIAIHVCNPILTIINTAKQLWANQEHGTEEINTIKCIYYSHQGKCGSGLAIHILPAMCKLPAKSGAMMRHTHVIHTNHFMHHITVQAHLLFDKKTQFGHTQQTGTVYTVV